MSATIGFIGLGIMGAAIDANLVAACYSPRISQKAAHA